MVAVTTDAAAWDHYAARRGVEGGGPLLAHYGPDGPTEEELHLLGDLRGKRVLDLGCGSGRASIAFAKAGATAVGIDFSAERLESARHNCAREEVRIELRHGDLADLAFLRADSIDAAFSSSALGYVEDLGRVFRQVHRVLKVGAPLAFAVPHPASVLFDLEADQPRVARRSYFDRAPLTTVRDGISFSGHHHSFAELYSGLTRASYRVDVVLEPEPPAGVPRDPRWRDLDGLVPRTLILRARKEGS
jgi:ubiquinone/menaquinone biosynthesis C-methylase UbiE